MGCLNGTWRHPAPWSETLAKSFPRAVIDHDVAALLLDVGEVVVEHELAVALLVVELLAFRPNFPKDLRGCCPKNQKSEDLYLILRLQWIGGDDDKTVRHRLLRVR
jgi:hypothetical protein